MIQKMRRTMEKMLQGPPSIQLSKASPAMRVYYSKFNRAWVSTYVDSDTGLEERLYFRPYKYGGGTEGYNKAKQAALQHRRDYFLNVIHAKKANPENVTLLKELMEEQKSYIREGDRNPPRIAPVDLAVLEDQARLRRIASAKKLPGMVRVVELPPSPSSAMTKCPESPMSIVVEVQPFEILKERTAS
eukprot:GEMP01099907.1.p1 GENE.GEMP01099907.1~~GEMP01099907.1.p1  ORF type:complete len:188 (+),score=35.15 GEMP01099907.1:31-594(+)